MHYPDEDRKIRDQFKGKKLVYLYTTIRGPGVPKRRIWAVDIDVNYPWAGGLTDHRKDATAFTPAFVRVINKRLDKSKMGRYFEEPAPKNHDGAICYLPHEIGQR